MTSRHAMFFDRLETEVAESQVRTAASEAARVSDELFATFDTLRT